MRLHDRVVVDVEETGRVLDPLDVAAYPVQVLGDPAEHLVRLRHYACPASPRTQVSLEPPPWEELTTSEPRLSATRVSPPGTTVMSSPTRTYGRRSTWQGSNTPDSAKNEGWRERGTTGCAT